MSGNYVDFSPKPLTVGSSIGNGEIELRHLAPELFSEIQNIRLHGHTGTKSRKIKLQDTIGYFGIDGFIAYSSDGSKKYKVTINSSTNAFVLTDIT